MNRKRKNKQNMNSFVVGIDVGEEKSVATYLSPDGEIRDEFEFAMNIEGYGEFATRIPKETRVAFEASGSAYVVNNTLRKLGYGNITVAHPKELSWIVKSKKKNDKVDSLKLAKLHLVNMFPESHLLNEEERIFRDLLIQRVKISNEISAAKNSIIGYLKREGLYDSLPESSNSFSEKRREAIRGIRFSNQKDLVLRTMIDRLEFFERQIDPLEEEIKTIARENEDVRLLMTIPGIDYYLPSLLSSYIGDIHRFQNANKLASFFGVIPETGIHLQLRGEGT